MDEKENDSLEEKEDEDWVDKMFSQTNEEKMTSDLDSIARTNASSNSKLDLIADKVLKASMESWKYDDYFKSICKSLSEIISDSKSNPIHKSQKEMIEFLDSRLPDKNEFQKVEENLNLQLKEIRTSLDAIKNKTEKKKSNLVPILLTAILIVLLIK